MSGYKYFSPEPPYTTPPGQRRLLQIYDDSCRVKVREITGEKACAPFGLAVPGPSRDPNAPALANRPMGHGDSVGPKWPRNSLGGPNGPKGDALSQPGYLPRRHLAMVGRGSFWFGFGTIARAPLGHGSNGTQASPWRLVCQGRLSPSQKLIGEPTPLSILPSLVLRGPAQDVSPHFRPILLRCRFNRSVE